MVNTNKGCWIAYKRDGKELPIIMIAHNSLTSHEAYIAFGGEIESKESFEANCVGGEAHVKNNIYMLHHSGALYSYTATEPRK